MSDPYFATGYIRLLYRVLQAEGLTPETLFRNTGYSHRDLMQADFEMPYPAEMMFCSNALAASSKGLGLRTGQQLQIAAHGVLGTAVQSAPDLETALRVFSELIGSRASFFSINVHSKGNRTTAHIALSGLPKELVTFFTESIFFSLSHCLTFYCGRNTQGVTYRLGYRKPKYWTNYKEVFGRKVEFECQATSIEFDRSLLSLPSPEADPLIHAESVLRCQGQIGVLKQSSLVATIEHFMLENPGKLWALRDLAPLYNCSERTLIRRLKHEGTSYQTLRDDLLKRQAVTFLKAMTVESTAIALGFSDTSSFRRSFVRWFGVTPSKFESEIEPTAFSGVQ